MVIYEYDGTFEGLLTCIFESYDRKQFPDVINIRGNDPADLFLTVNFIESEPIKAERVWKKIQQLMPLPINQIIYYAFLSETKGIEMSILHFCRRLFQNEKNVYTDFGDNDVLKIVQVARKVKREAARIKQFVRFQEAKDGIYFSGIEPIYDVLPLVVSHFKHRYLDQKWLIYDLKRNYGAHYDLKTIDEVELTSIELNQQTGQISKNVLKEEDALYQTLWKSYFENINIEERKNLRLQRQMMPKRFWRYLTEKQ